MRTALLVTLLVTLLHALVAGTVRSDDGPTTRIPVPHPVLPERDWYGVYQGRRKVGWACLELRLEGEGEAARYVSRSRVDAVLTGLGQRLHFTLDATDVFRGTPPFELLASREERRDGDVPRTTRLDRQDDGRYGVERTEGEDTEVRALEDLAYTLADRLCQIHWGARGPAVGERLHVREFEIMKLQHDVYGYEVRRVRQRAARGLGIEVRDVRIHSHAQGALGTLVMDADGRMLRGPLAGVAELRLESEEQAKNGRWASDLFAFGRVPATEAIGVPGSVRRLEIAVYGRGHERFASGPRQAVRTTADGDTLLLLGEDAGPGEPPSEADVAAASAPTAAYPSENEDVLALARRAVGDAEAPDERVARLVGFVSSHVRDLALPSEYSVPRLLLEPKGDSTEHARFFVTLARALGIPAREVRGLVYLGDEETAWGGHAWAEVVLDGRWQPVDPTWNLVTPTATHVAIERGSEAWATLLARTRHLTFEIRAVEHGR